MVLAFWMVLWMLRCSGYFWVGSCARRTSPDLIRAADVLHPNRGRLAAGAPLRAEFGGRRRDVRDALQRREARGLRTGRHGRTDGGSDAKRAGSHKNCMVRIFGGSVLGIPSCTKDWAKRSFFGIRSELHSRSASLSSSVPRRWRRLPSAPTRPKQL